MRGDFVELFDSDVESFVADLLDLERSFLLEEGLVFLREDRLFFSGVVPILNTGCVVTLGRGGGGGIGGEGYDGNAN